MTSYNITITFTAAGLSDTEDARDMGIAVAEHIQDTFNDNKSIDPLVAICVERKGGL